MRKRAREKQSLRISQKESYLPAQQICTLRPNFLYYILVLILMGCFIQFDKLVHIKNLIFKRSSSCLEYQMFYLILIGQNQSQCPMFQSNQFLSNHLLFLSILISLILRFSYNKNNFYSNPRFLIKCI